MTNSFIDIFHEKKASAITSHLSSAQESTTSRGLGQTQKRGGVKPVKGFLSFFFLALCAIEISMWLPTLLIKKKN